MRDAAPKDVLGYVAISLPEAGHWQGFFVTPALRKGGEAMLADIRKANAAAGAAGTEVDNGLPGVAAEDQPTVGALSAVAAHYFSLGTAKPPPSGLQAKAIMTGVSSAIYALHAVTREPYLLVTGRRDPHGRPGYGTDVRRIEAADLDEARERIAAAIAHEKATRGMADSFMDMMRRAGGPREG